MGGKTWGKQGMFGWVRRYRKISRGCVDADFGKKKGRQPALDALHCASAALRRAFPLMQRAAPPPPGTDAPPLAIAARARRP